MEIYTTQQDLGNVDVFKELYEFAENQKLQDTNTLTILKFNEATQALEVQSNSFIEESKENIAIIAHNYLEATLKVFLYVLQRGGLLDRPILTAYFRYLKFLELIFDKEKSSTNELFFSRNFTINFPSLVGPKARYYDILFVKNHIDHGLPKDLTEKDPFYLNMDFKKLELSIEYDFNLKDRTIVPYDKESEIINFYLKDYMVEQFIFNPNDNELVFQKDYYEYVLDLSVHDLNKDAQKMTSSLYKILSSISSIENVNIEFENLERGSILARLRIKMKDFVAKNEVKNFFILLRELIFGIMTGGKISALETLKKTAEKDKIEMEKKLLQKKIDEESDKTNIEKHRLLDIERKELENRRLEIQNNSDRLSNLKTIVELAKDGILEADLTKIDLNGINFINTHAGEILDSEEDLDKMT